ncbi:hypothetical protein [Allopontixanthobacter sp.]|uniref:hypothetical protein n=1 Tax=Allopontixanthobacter sp. TaxID=2906452 RepID=UPI002ABC6CBA|nr:hypothetical protein [Allopontixanthobacter sp.]MDZ4306924.1 hypothetical protein [Allopontixanthobacter sp.]
MTIHTIKRDTLAAHRARKAYQLQFPVDRKNAAKTIDFESDDGHEAFILLESEAPARPGELWFDGRPLCDLMRDENGVWTITPSEPPQKMVGRRKRSFAGRVSKEGPASSYLARTLGVV